MVSGISETLLLLMSISNKLPHKRTPVGNVCIKLNERSTSFTVLYLKESLCNSANRLRDTDNLTIAIISDIDLPSSLILFSSNESSVKLDLQPSSSLVMQRIILLLADKRFKLQHPMMQLGKDSNWFDDISN
jgi:hypothetical protein